MHYGGAREPDPARQKLREAESLSGLFSAIDPDFKPKAGDDVILGSSDTSATQNDYEQYAELKAAGNDAKEFTGFVGDSVELKHKWSLLVEGSRVRVLSKVPGGVKVVVERATEVDLLSGLEVKKRIIKERAEMNGTIGYIHLGDIH